MADELIHNNGVSTLNGGINDSVTSLDVADASTFPTTGNFRIKIDNEIMIVTGVSTNTFTVTRHAESTSAASHSDGATVTHPITTGAITQMFQDYIKRGTFANIPVTRSAGRIYKCTDSPYEVHDNGASLQYYFLGHPVTPPVLADYTWQNQGGATTDTTYGGIQVSCPTDTGGAQARLLWKAVPGGAYKYTLGFMPRLTTTYHTAGIYLCDDTYKGIMWRATVRSVSLSIDAAQNASLTSQSDVANGLAFGAMNAPIWLQIEDDTTNRIYKYSADGIYWQTLKSETRTTYMTPTKIGFAIQAWNSSVPCGIWVFQAG